MPVRRCYDRRPKIGNGASALAAEGGFSTLLGAMSDGRMIPFVTGTGCSPSRSRVFDHWYRRIHSNYIWRIKNCKQGTQNVIIILFRLAVSPLPLPRAALLPVIPFC